jgi:hypothetical protein
MSVCERARTFVRACVTVFVSMSGRGSREISVFFSATVLFRTVMTGSNCFGLIEGVFYRWRTASKNK